MHSSSPFQCPDRSRKQRIGIRLPQEGSITSPGTGLLIVHDSLLTSVRSSRNQAALVAFTLPKKWAHGSGISVVATHVDSPNLRVRPISTELHTVPVTLSRSDLSPNVARRDIYKLESKRMGAVSGILGWTGISRSPVAWWLQSNLALSNPNL